MPSTLRSSRVLENVRTSELCSGGSASSPEPAGELGPRAHAQLGVDAGQVTRNRALGEEERRGDLGVRPSRRHEGGDAPLGRRQALDARTPADLTELLARSVRPACGSELLEAGARRLDRLARRRFCRARRRTTPSASSARAGRTGRRPPRAASTASSSRDTAPSTSPRAAATSPRHRVACASTQSRSEPAPVRLPGVETARRLRRRGRARAAPRPDRRATSTCSDRLRRRRRPPRSAPPLRSPQPPPPSLRSRDRRRPASRQGRRAAFRAARPAGRCVRRTRGRARGRRGGRQRAPAATDSSAIRNPGGRSDHSSSAPARRTRPPARGGPSEARRLRGTRAHMRPSVRRDSLHSR